MITPYQLLLDRLRPVYPEGEARALARHVLEVRFGITLTDICMGRCRDFSSEERLALENIVNRLCQKEPVQYVLGRASFSGRTFIVAPGVLIPRPETEELAEWVALDGKERSEMPLRVLDVGTGSGCIAITLAKNFPRWQVTATDISAIALDIARMNAAALGAAVCLDEQDILAAAGDAKPDSWDVIVSNPPYIRREEYDDMDDNVRKYESHTALFVPDDDPLLFYRAIGQYAAASLAHGGLLYVETNRAFAHDVARLFGDLGLRDAEVRKDMFGNDRMVKCRK